MFFYGIDKLDFAMSDGPAEKLHKLCKDLSDTFHWNIEARTEVGDDFYWIYKNNALLHCVSNFDLQKNCEMMCDKVERMVRNTL